MNIELLQTILVNYYIICKNLVIFVSNRDINPSKSLNNEKNLPTIIASIWIVFFS